MEYPCKECTSKVCVHCPRWTEWFKCRWKAIREDLATEKLEKLKMKDMLRDEITSYGKVISNVSDEQEKTRLRELVQLKRKLLNKLEG